MYLCFSTCFLFSRFYFSCSDAHLGVKGDAAHTLVVRALKGTCFHLLVPENRGIKLEYLQWQTAVVKKY